MNGQTLPLSTSFNWLLCIRCARQVTQSDLKLSGDLSPPRGLETLSQQTRSVARSHVGSTLAGRWPSPLNSATVHATSHISTPNLARRRPSPGAGPIVGGAGAPFHQSRTPHGTRHHRGRREAPSASRESADRDSAAGRANAEVRRGSADTRSRRWHALHFRVLIHALEYSLELDDGPRIWVKPSVIVPQSLLDGPTEGHRSMNWSAPWTGL